MDLPLVVRASLAAFLLSVPALEPDLRKWKAHLPCSDSPIMKNKMEAWKGDSSSSCLTLSLSFPLSVPVVSSICLMRHNVICYCSMTRQILRSQCFRVLRLCLWVKTSCTVHLCSVHRVTLNEPDSTNFKSTGPDLLIWPIMAICKQWIVLLEDSNTLNRSTEFQLRCGKPFTCLILQRTCLTRDHLEAAL